MIPRTSCHVLLERVLGEVRDPEFEAIWSEIAPDYRIAIMLVANSVAGQPAGGSWHPSGGGFPCVHFTHRQPRMEEVFLALGLAWARIGRGVTVWQGGELPSENLTLVNLNSASLVPLRFYLEKKLFGERHE